MKYLLLLGLLLFPTYGNSQEKGSTIPKSSTSFFEGITCYQVHKQDKYTNMTVITCESTKIACFLSCGHFDTPCIPVCFLKGK